MSGGTSAERARRDNEERLRLALEASAASTWSWEAAGNACTWDARFAEQYGFTAQAPRTLERWVAAVHEDDRGRVHARLEALRRGEGGDLWDLELRVRRPGGAIVWLHTLGRAERDADGQVTRLSGIQLDVTARKHTEAALREERERLELALEAASAGSWTLDLVADQGEADARMCARLGLPPDRPFPIERFLSRVHPADRGMVRANIDAVRRTPAEGWQTDYRALRPDGTVCWCHSVGRAERDASGRAVRVSGISLDITQRKAAEFAVARAHLDLQARAAELEARTTQLTQLASELTLAEQHARERLAKTLHDHLQQLLFSSRLKLDRASRRIAEGAPGQADLVDRARQELDEAIAAARSLAIELSPPMLHEGGLPAALAWLAGWVQQKYGLSVALTAHAEANPGRRDVRTLVFESVRELLFNVVKHAQVDRATLDLDVTPAGDILIRVADRGAGFEPALVFHPSHPRPSGLGLFSLRERLALFGARLEVQSAPGRGAQFTLLVPVAADGATWKGTPAARAAPLQAGSRSLPLTVLIADDHALVRDGLRELLGERPELRVVGEAVNGRDAVAQAHALRPDVVIMDVSMPEMDGVEATRHIRAELPFIQVFGLSTQERMDQLHAIEAAGAAGYFSKSEDTHRLIERLLALQARGLTHAR